MDTKPSYAMIKTLTATMYSVFRCSIWKVMKTFRACLRGCTGCRV